MASTLNYIEYSKLNRGAAMPTRVGQVKQDLKGRRVLVVGCGFGDDALRLAKLGVEVYAFDLSPESLDIAKQLALREGLDVHFAQMPAERLTYESDFFDCVVARDILYHVDIPRAMNEIIRACRNNALFVIYEVYSHSVTDRIRRSQFVEKYVYPLMQNFVYGGEKSYITEDERKLTEHDIAETIKPLGELELEKYFNCFVDRIVHGQVRARIQTGSATADRS